jgi:hypothetical protein
MSKATGDEALITSIRTFNEKSRKNRGKLQREFNDYEEANKEGFLDTTPGKLTLTGIGAGLAVLVGILWPKGKQSVPEPNGDGDDTTGGSGSGPPSPSRHKTNKSGNTNTNKYSFTSCFFTNTPSRNLRYFRTIHAIRY